MRRHDFRSLLLVDVTVFRTVLSGVMAAMVASSVSIAEMEAQLQEIMQQNELLLKENELFMTFLQRNECLDDEDDMASPGGKKKGTSSVTHAVSSARLTELQWCVCGANGEGGGERV